MEDIEDLGANSPNSQYCLTHGSILVAVVTKRFFFLETPVDIFGEKSSKGPESLKVLECITG